MAGPIEPVQYILMDPKQRMSTGKRCAQAAHASVEGVMISKERDVERWRLGGHYTKIVLMCGDLQVTTTYLRERGFEIAVIIDEGRTEFEEFTPTAIGTAILNKNDPHTAATFGEFKLYNETQHPGPLVIIEKDGRVSPEEYDKVRALVKEGRLDEARTILRATNTGGRLGVSQHEPSKLWKWMKERLSF